MEKNKKQALLADGAMLLATIIWGSGFVGNKVLLNGGMGPMQLIAIRFIIASIVLLIPFRKRLLNNRPQLKAGIIIGIALFFSYILQTIGLQYTTASNNAFLTATYVIIVPLLAYFMTRKKPDNYNIIAAVMTFIGIALLTIDFTNLGFGPTIKGDLLTLVAAVSFAFQVSLIAQYSKKYDPIALAVIQIIFVAVASTISALIFEGTSFTITPSGTGILLYLAVIATALCLVLQNVAQKYTTPTHAGIIMSLESVFGTLFGVLLLDELVTAQMGVGFIIIFLALIIAETKLAFLKKRRYAPAAKKEK